MTTITDLHPLPWTVRDDCYFSEATPLTLWDAAGLPIAAIAGFDEHEATEPRDHVVAAGIVAAVAAVRQATRQLDDQPS